MHKFTLFYNCLDSADSAFYSQDTTESEHGNDDDLFTITKEKCQLKSTDDDRSEKEKHVCHYYPLFLILKDY